jgi:hypothetical protein
MTIASDDNRKAGPYTCNGATVTFSFSFKVFAASTDLAVVLADADGDETDLVYSTDYSVSLNSDQNANPGGTITTVSTYATGYFITILSDVPATQNTSIPSPSAFSPTVIEAALDRLTALVLDARTSLARVLRGPRSDDDDVIELPPAAQRAGFLLGFDVTGQPTALSSGTSASVSSAMADVVNAASVDTARSLLGAQGAGPSNIALSASAAAGALTITLTGRDGNALSASNPGSVSIPSSSTDLWPTALSMTSAQSFTVPSGAQFGVLANIPFRLWVVAFNIGGTLTLGAINPVRLGGSGFPFDTDFDIYPLRAMGTANIVETINTASDLAGSFYHTGIFTLTRYGYAVLGCIEYQVGLAASGVWTAPSAVVTWEPGMPLPGQIVKTYASRITAVATGATVMPVDDTIPQKTEGNVFLTASDQSYTADLSGTLYDSARCNVLHVRVTAELASSNTDIGIAGAIFVNTEADAVAASVAARPATAGARCTLNLDYYGPNRDSADNKISGVYFRAGTASAGTTTFNGSAGVRTFGGRMASQIVCQEIMT